MKTYPKEKVKQVIPALLVSVTICLAGATAESIRGHVGWAQFLSLCTIFGLRELAIYCTEEEEHDTP